MTYKEWITKTVGKFQLSTDEADKTEYENYLKEVLAVKAMVRADLAAAGIDVGAAGI